MKAINECTELIMKKVESSKSVVSKCVSYSEKDLLKLKIDHKELDNIQIWRLVAKTLGFVCSLIEGRSNEAAKIS